MVTTTSVPAATVGVKYTAFQLQASGASTRVKWKLTGGAIPLGLHLRSNGRLQGRPNKHDVAGTYAFTVEASTHHAHSQETTPPTEISLTLLP